MVLQPTSSDTCRPIRLPSATVFSGVTQPALCTIARWNRPDVSFGARMCMHTLAAPADWPARVMLAGSPPNLAMLRFTHRSAAR